MKPGIPESEGPLFNPPALRKDVEVFKVQDNVYFQVYWKQYGEGKGPAVILYLFGIESIKFDLYGKGAGHFHVNPNNPESGNANLLWLPEDDANRQVRRAVFELKHNIYFYLQRNVDRRIRELRIDASRWDAALVAIESKVLDILATVPQLRDV